MPVPITAYAALNGLGASTEEVAEALFQGRRGLTPCPLDVPFETVNGVVPGPLMAMPPGSAGHDSRLAASP